MAGQSVDAWRCAREQAGVPLPAQTEPADWNDITRDPGHAVGHTLACDCLCASYDGRL